MSARTSIALTLTAAAVLVVAVVAYKWYCEYRIHLVYGRRSPTAQVVSRYLREFNALSQVQGYRHLFGEFVKQNPTFFDNNEYNKGAEVLFRVLDGRVHWTSDTDHDGLPEAADETGEPLVFLTDELPRDTILLQGGASKEVVRPPYCCSGGVYINLEAFHVWFPGDQEALERYREGMDPRP